jgi:hypothetical protein
VVRHRGSASHVRSQAVSLGTRRLLTQAQGAVDDPRVTHDAGLSHRHTSLARHVAPHRHQLIFNPALRRVRT